MSILALFLKVMLLISSLNPCLVSVIKFHVAKKFRVIDEEKQQSVIVPWKQGINLISEFRDKENLTIDDWRKLQRYTVNLPDTKEYSSVEKCPNGLIIWSGNYDLNFGIN